MFARGLLQARKSGTVSKSIDCVIICPAASIQLYEVGTVLSGSIEIEPSPGQQQPDNRPAGRPDHRFIRPSPTTLSKEDIVAQFNYTILSVEIDLSCG